MKLIEAKDKYLRDQKLRGSTPKTVSGYKEILTAFIRYTGNLDLKELDIEVIRDYQEHIFDKGISTTSIASYMRHIKAFVHYLGENEYIDDREMFKKIKLPKKAKRVVDLFSPDDMERIFEGIDSFPEWIRLRNCLIIALMYDSGLRQAELCSIKIGDMNVDSNILKVHGKGNKERYVPVGNTTRSFLREYLLELPFESEYLLLDKGGNQLTTNTVKKFVAKLRKKLDMPNLSSHKLRHNFATNYVIDMYREKGNVDLYKLSAILGHEDLETTKVYLHVANQMIAASTNISHLDYIKNITEKG